MATKRKCGGAFNSKNATTSYNTGIQHQLCFAFGVETNLTSNLAFTVTNIPEGLYVPLLMYPSEEPFAL